MGAASSFPAVLTEEHAALVAGPANWAKVKDKWPAGAVSVTRDELEAMVNADAEVSTLVVNWDEMPVGTTTQAADQPTEFATGQVVKKKRCVTARRKKFDAAEKRRAKIATENGIAAAAGVPKPPGCPTGATPMKHEDASDDAPETHKKTPASARKEQSEALRSMMRQQRKAARAAQQQQEVACELYVKTEEGSTAVEVVPVGAEPTVIKFGDKTSDKPQVTTFSDADVAKTTDQPEPTLLTSQSSPILPGAPPTEPPADQAKADSTCDELQTESDAATAPVAENAPADAEPPVATAEPTDGPTKPASLPAAEPAAAEPAAAVPAN